MAMLLPAAWFAIIRFLLYSILLYTSYSSWLPNSIKSNEMIGDKLSQILTLTWTFDIYNHCFFLCYCIHLLLISFSEHKVLKICLGNSDYHSLLFTTYLNLLTFLSNGKIFLDLSDLSFLCKFLENIFGTNYFCFLDSYPFLQQFGFNHKLKFQVKHLSSKPPVNFSYWTTWQHVVLLAISTSLKSINCHFCDTT